MSVILELFARQILEYLCRSEPYERCPVSFHSRGEITGELRLSLIEYDQACGQLARLRLIVTDQPTSGDCDFIAPTKAGRRLVGRQPQPGSLAWRILATLAAQPPAGDIAPGAYPAQPAGVILEAVGLKPDTAGIHLYQAACQALYDWDLIARQTEGANCYARIGLTQAGEAFIQSH